MSAFTYHAMRGQYKHESVSGTCPLTLPTNISCVIPRLLVHGNTIQNGTPGENSPVTLESAGSELLFGLGDSPIYIPTLRSAGEVSDVYDIKTGKITRNTVEIVVDGVKLTTGNAYVQNNGLTICTLRTGYLPRYALEVVSTHFVTEANAHHTGRIYQSVDWFILVFWDGSMKNVADVNAWFKAQYDAGTPVKIVHALREPVVEDAPAYTPIQRAGGSIITDSGNAAGVTLDVTYLKHA